MRATQPYLPSFSLVLSQASYLMHLPNYHPKLLSRQPKTILSPIHDDLMQTVDERDYISHMGLDVATTCILEHNDGLVGLREALATNVPDNSVKERRLSISSLLIDVAFALRRKCHQFCVKKHVTEVDNSALD